MDVTSIRKDFPLLKKTIDDMPIIYFDNACMTLKPNQVINTINEYYTQYSACAGRSIHKLGSTVTIHYEEAREKIQHFINAEEAREIIFTKNATEGINLIAQSLPFHQGDVVVTTDREHNSNLIPWHMQKKKRGISHKVIRSNVDHTFDVERFEQEMNTKVKLVSIVHTSNLDGYTLPAAEIIKIAHDYGALVLLDGAQSASRLPIDVQQLDVDLFVFSFHKMLGPTGIGALYGKAHILRELEPFIVGGNTVEMSTYDSSTLLDIPEKFEAGLQDYAGAMGAGAAVEYLTAIGKPTIANHISSLNSYITKQLQDIPALRIIGPQDPKLRSGIFCFTIKDKEPHTVAMHLDTANIMVRSGVFCVHSWFKAQKLPGAVRASLYLYNTKEECKLFVEHIEALLR